MMKRTLLLSALSLASTLTIAQTQIGNSDFEAWEPVAGAEEPNNWNGFLTAGGNWAWAAQNQLEQSATVRPGSTGTKSARIWSRSAFGIIANGNLTLGQIEMGSTTPTDPSNYNHTVTGDADFSEAMPDQPDSIVFWANFTPNGHNENARMKASIHTDYNYRDPEDAASSAELVANAVVNYPNTNGWQRISVPFDYAAGPATAQAYILVTFSTNEVGGGGAADDEVLIDDVELIYNPNSVDELSSYMNVFMNNDTEELTFKSTQPFEGQYVIYDMSGKVAQSGDVAHKIAFNGSTGAYIVDATINGVSVQYKIFKK